MSNMGRRSRGLSLAVALLVALAGMAQEKKDKDRKERDYNPFDNKYSIRKTGPFIGIEQGTYTNFVFGAETQWKQLKLIQARTHAVFYELDYNFKYSIMGGQVGYWYKGGRVNLIYGARVSWRSDFIYHRFGISPTIGYKILQADLQLGYHFMPPDKNLKDVNTFYASIKYVFVNKRKIKKKAG